MGGRSKQAVTEENLWGVTWEKLSEILTEEDVMTILKSKAGQKKHVKQKYRMVIGQADLLTQEQVEKFKKEQGICLYSRKGGADTNGENIGIS